MTDGQTDRISVSVSRINMLTRDNATVTRMIALRFDWRSTRAFNCLSKAIKPDVTGAVNPPAAVTLTYLFTMPPPPIAGALSVDARLTSGVCLSRTPGLSREDRDLGRLKLAQVAHVTRDSDTTFKVKRSLQEAGAACLGRIAAARS